MGTLQLRMLSLVGSAPQQRISSCLVTGPFPDRGDKDMQRHMHLWNAGCSPPEWTPDHGGCRGLSRPSKLAGELARPSTAGTQLEGVRLLTIWKDVSFCLEPAG